VGAQRGERATRGGTRSPERIRTMEAAARTASAAERGDPMTAQARRGRVVAMSFAVMTLAACEGGPLVQEKLSFEPLQGQWIVCLNGGAGDYSKYMLFFPDASFRTTTRTYTTTDRTCTGTETSVSHAPSTYRLVGDVSARIGPDGREVVAKQMNIENSYEIVYTIVYVDGEAAPAVLYFGDLALNPLQDGTAPERRPQVLSASTALTGQ
jgi:hypothetical protein